MTPPRWLSLTALCRELDWSRRRALYELQNGLRYRTIPPGHLIDWRHPDVERSLDVAASEVTYTKGVLDVEGVVGLDWPTVGIEVLPPDDSEAPAALASVTWARDAARELRDTRKIPEGAKKADLARLLQIESQKAVKAGNIRRALKASYFPAQN
jgi:hypothetical protein